MASFQPSRASPLPSPAKRGFAQSAWGINLFGAVLVMYGLWAYFNSLAGPFVFDDIPMIAENPGLLRWWPPTAFGSRRAVAHLSFALDRRCWGLYPVGYHATNLAIHILASLVLYGLVRRTLLLPHMPARFRRASTFLAFSVALVWLVHPLTTAAVTYLVQRLESLAGLGYLACLYCLVRGHASPRGGAWRAAALVAGSAAIFTKEIAVTLPLVALAYHRIYLARSWHETARHGAWFAALTLPAVAILWRLVPEVTHGQATSVGVAVPGISPLTYLASQGGVLLHYLQLAVWPQTLCLDYAWPPVAPIAEAWPACLAIGGLLLATLLGLWFFPRIAFPAFCFFVVLAPTSSFVPLADLAFEHRMYLPLAALVVWGVLAGHFLLRALFLPRFWERIGQRRFRCRAQPRVLRQRAAMARRVAAIAVLHFVSQALLLRTIARNNDFRSHVALGEATVAAAPQNARARVNLGGAYVLENRLEEAEFHLRESLRLLPNAQAHSYLGLIALQRQAEDEAERHYRTALQIHPGFAHAHHLLGQLYWRQAKAEAARAEFQLAVRLAPGYAPALAQLAEVEFARGETAAAITHLQQALAMQPESRPALRALAWLRSTALEAKHRSGAEALACAERLVGQGIELSADELDAWAAALAENGRFAEAARVADRALAALPPQRTELAQEIASRRELYQSGLPFRHRPTR